MNQDILLISLSLLTWGFGESAFLQFLPLYLQQLGAQPVEIGGILGAFSLAAAIFHLPAGYLSDKIGRKPVIIAAWFIGLIGVIIMALVHSLPLFIVSIFIYGSTSFVMPPLNSYLSHISSKFSVARVLTFVSAAYNLGAMFGPLIGGYIGDHFGLNKIFYFSAGIIVISNVMINFIHSQPSLQQQKPTKALRSVFNKNFLLFNSVLVFMIFATYLPQPLTPNFLRNQLNFSLSTIGFLFFINGAGIVVLNLLIGGLNAYLGLLIGQIFVLIFSLILCRWSTLPLIAMGIFILGGFRAARTMGTAQLRCYIKPENLGMAFGFSEMVIALGLFLSSSFAGYLYNHQPTAMYYIGSGLIALSIVFSILFKSLEKHPELE
ncbi:MAG: MFS transporter [Anaerolineales bacterium]